MGKAANLIFVLTEGLAVAAMAVLVLATLGPAHSDLHREARELAGRLVRARAEAMLTGRTVEVSLGQAGYDFDILDLGVRTPLISASFTRGPWAAGTSVCARLRVVFDPTGATQPQSIDLTRGGQKVSVLIDGSGGVNLRPG